ncbi:hypothetical protein RvY_01393 [Ramazzottius varieornatus]|uniref:Chitin-binding type-2 domain-containing protein n=1 Tax=Ramazzottius varieornatus TaxID=947166 RepID=A0A1D1UGI4_RAMVA|nr:hypothetical protein RvY_01393 [Ramazzottius varieornatus]
MEVRVSLSIICLFIGVPYRGATPSHAVPKWVIFNCASRPAGFYADRVRGCHVFNFCSVSGLKFEFVCPNDMLFDTGKVDCVDPALVPVSCPTIWEVPDVSQGMVVAPAEMLAGEEDLVNAVLPPRSSERLSGSGTNARNLMDSIRGLVVVPDGTTSPTPLRSTTIKRRSRRTTLVTSTNSSK